MAKPISEALSAIQVVINDVAKSVGGYKREDHIPIEDLLDSAKFMSLNQIEVQAMAMDAWNAHVSKHGVAGTRNPVDNLMFDSSNALTVK
jgi:hypothetical protein